MRYSTYLCGNKPTTELTTSKFSSNIIYNYKTTTDDSISKKTTLPEEWATLDIEPLSSIGFTVTHLSQVASKNMLTLDMLQDSIFYGDS